jgi:hypothetical protein
LKLVVTVICTAIARPSTTTGVNPKPTTGWMAAQAKRGCELRITVARRMHPVGAIATFIVTMPDARSACADCG